MALGHPPPFCLSSSEPTGLTSSSRNGYQSWLGDLGWELTMDVKKKRKKWDRLQYKLDSKISEPSTVSHEIIWVQIRNHFNSQKKSHHDILVVFTHQKQNHGAPKRHPQLSSKSSGRIPAPWRIVPSYHIPCMYKYTKWLLICQMVFLKFMFMPNLGVTRK